MCADGRNAGIGLSMYLACARWRRWWSTTRDAWRSGRPRAIVGARRCSSTAEPAGSRSCGWCRQPEMPTAPPRPCAKPGCRALVSGPQRYCTAHQRAVRREVDERRGSAAKRGYDWRWQTVVRPAALSREPLCRSCMERSRVTIATEVDHIDGDSRNNASTNLRSLCKPCHSRRTAQDQAFGRRR